MPCEDTARGDVVRAEPCAKCTRRWSSEFVGGLLSVPVRAYRLIVSPWMAPRCRFIPTCSDYALQALQQHGPLTGSWLALRRLLRCHPWGRSGLDEVPVVRCRCVGVRLPVSLPIVSDSQRAESHGKSAAFRAFG